MNAYRVCILPVKPTQACRPAVKLGGEGAELTRRRGVVFGEDRYEVTVNSAIDACGIGLDAFQQIA